MSSWHDRLEYALQKRGKRWPDLVAVTGLSKPSVYAWRPGATKRTEMMNADNAAIVCAYLGINSTWLFESRGPSGLENEHADHGYVQHVSETKDEILIPQFDTRGVDHKLVLRDQPGVIREWAVNSEWLRHNVHRITSAANLAIVTGFGDTMKPLFNSGDPLLVDTGRRRADVDGIYFFRVGDEGFIKRLQRIPTAKGMVLRAKSESPHYDPFDITSDMDFEVFGWVVKAWRGDDF